MCVPTYEGGMTAAEAESAREESERMLARSDGRVVVDVPQFAIHPHGIGTI